MSFRIVEQRLSESREPLETVTLPQRFESESRAETAIKMKIASADHAGYDSERNLWWAHNEGRERLRYYVEADGA